MNASARRPCRIQSGPAPRRQRLLSALAWLLGSGPLVADVIFERTVPPEVLEAHQVIATNSFFDPLTEEQLQKLIEEAKRDAEADETTLKLELLSDKEQNGRPYFRNTHLGRNLVKEQKSLEWFQEASGRFAISEAVGKTVPIGRGTALDADGGLKKAGYIFFEGIPESGWFTQRFRGPEKQLIFVDFRDSGDRVIDHHQFLRSRIQDDCHVVKRSFGYVIQSRDRWGKSTEGGKGRGASWLHGTSLRVEVLALGKLPDDLVDAVGRRFPSSLPPEFEIDKTAWGREEMRYYLARMRRALASGDEGGKKTQGYAFFLEQTKGYLFIPPLIGTPTMEDATLEQKKRQFEKLEEWWKENEHKTEWHEKLQQLAARGQRPEDLEAAAKEYEEKRRQEILDAPLTEEFMERVEEKLVTQFEREMNEHLEWRNKSSGKTGSFEKTDAGWTLIHGDLVGYRWVYERPKVRRRLFSEERPLNATFTVTCFKDGKKDGTSRRRYEFEKLTDTWVRKSEP